MSDLHPLRKSRGRAYSDTGIGTLVSARKGNLGRARTAPTSDFDLSTANVELGTRVARSSMESNLHKRVNIYFQTD